MFSCLGYPNQIRVTPVTTNTTTTYSQLPNIPQITYTGLNNTAIIRIEGMGTNTPYCSKTMKTKDNVHFVNVSYASRGFTTDLRHLKRHVIKLGSGTFTMSDEGRRSQEKIYKLINTIKKHLIDGSIQTVIVVGISHGSLLVHAALLKLQMDMDLDAVLVKLHIYTIGSPRYLPKGLLAEDQLLNFYHVRDKMIRLVKLLPFGGFQVPDLKGMEEQMTSLGLRSTTLTNTALHSSTPYSSQDDPKYHLYDAGKAIVYVNRDNFIPDALSSVSIKYPERYYFPNFEKNVGGVFDFDLFHGTPFILYPIMDFSTMYTLSEFPEHTLLDLAPCNEKQGGGGSKSHDIKYQNKVYKIRKDKVGKYIVVKKTKTYLSEIRGKYRYNK